MKDFKFGTDDFDLLPPMDPVENVRYRVALREWAARSKANQRWVAARSLRDIKWWINSFAWGHDPRPRKGLPPVVPFILREHQVELITDMRAKLGYQDMGVRKSRGEGLSFLCLILFLHSWLFEHDRNYLIISRTELSADSPNDSSSLGWKLDMIMKTLPEWMIGKKNVDWVRSTQRHTWVNRKNGSQIVSTSNTGDVAAGGRCTAMLFDEFARFAKDTEILTTTEPVSDCRIFCSTFVGNQNEFYRLMHEESDMLKRQLLWRDNPERNQNPFLVDVRKRLLLHPVTMKPVLPGYTPKFFREYYPILLSRGYELNNGRFPLTPWAVTRMIRPRITPAVFSQEYEGIVADESSSFFPTPLITKLIERAVDPTWIGDLVVHPETLKIISRTRLPDGPFRLYGNIITPTGRPLPGNYVLGADVSLGLGGEYGSNSVISVANRRTGQKVAEFISSITTPDRLAETTIALANWFSNEDGSPGYIIFEANGPGKTFGRRVEDASFGNMHYRVPAVTGRGKANRREPGWWTSLESKQILLTKYRSALESGMFENPSRDALEETLCYKVLPGNKIEFQKPGKSTAGAGASHADCVIADALAFYAAEELGGGPGEYTAKKRAKIDLSKAPKTSFGYRTYKAEEAKRKVNRYEW